ncbi:unnamed protein product [Zymoseptoria tritici ST99CH_3D7]|uniref:Tyrosinase copper-binding domain-containing protein n=1 Tax=Zymoseptoria tritici (strain ST99CH_3D7) TaxID=1276538 RepID=A0A1X7RU91_ZYMT9|nr:unnamed protein product [Zymoseptoria tritici ST99CH_3D7]
MFPPWKDGRIFNSYDSLPGQDEHEGGCQKEDLDRTSRRDQVRLGILWLVAGVAALVSLMLTLRAYLLPSLYGVCQNPAVRQEWRTLSSDQQLHYIDAVSCLMRQPSAVDPRTSLYDDFIYTHLKAGSYSHYAAAFLAWHRLFIHHYEQTLKSACGFKGQLPYWDWTLDWDDLSSSPVWDVVYGFGGDGSAEGEVVLQNGRCVTDGPFANSIRAYKAIRGEGDHVAHEVSFDPHCLSRGFKNDSLLDTLQSLVSPSSVQEVLAQSNYEAFFEAFETGAHNAIPQFISGDFLSFGAPNDPVFWLHHTQVDRLWWLWQQQEPDTRLKQFGGPTRDFRYTDGGNGSSLQDNLPMAGLFGEQSVAEVMNAENGILCYRY